MSREKLRASEVARLAGAALGFGGVLALFRALEPLDYWLVLSGAMALLAGALVHQWRPPVVAAFAWSGHWLFAAWLVLATLAMVLYALGPFVLFGMPWRYLLTLARLPYYAAWKVWVALQGKPGGWVRTAREPTVSPAASETKGPTARSE